MRNIRLCRIIYFLLIPTVGDINKMWITRKEIIAIKDGSLLRKRGMPKRKVKEEKPPKRLGKKEILIAPIAMGASLLVALVIIPHFAPPPIPTRICLKAHNVDSFNLYPIVQVVVNGYSRTASKWSR